MRPLPQPQRYHCAAAVCGTALKLCPPREGCRSIAVSEIASRHRPAEVGALREQPHRLAAREGFRQEPNVPARPIVPSEQAQATSIAGQTE